MIYQISANTLFVHFVFRAVRAHVLPRLRREHALRSNLNIAVPCILCSRNFLYSSTGKTDGIAKQHLAPDRFCSATGTFHVQAPHPPPKHAHRFVSLRTDDRTPRRSPTAEDASLPATHPTLTVGSPNKRAQVTPAQKSRIPFSRLFLHAAKRETSHKDTRA